MTRYRNYVAPVGASDSHVVDNARQYAAAVGNFPDRAAWAGRVAALVVRDGARLADVLIGQYRDAVAAGDVDAVAQIVADVTRCAEGRLTRGDDLRRYRGSEWVHAVTRWRGLTDGAHHAGAFEFRARFAAAVLDMPDTVHTVPGAVWTDYIANGGSRPFAWAEYGDSLARLERRARDIYGALGVPSCWRCGACGPVGGEGHCQECDRFMTVCAGGCGDTIDTAESVGVGGEEWCESCARDHLERCTDCGTWSDPDDGPACNCAQASVNSYGYHPTPAFRSMAGADVVASWHAPADDMTGREALVMGVEIELESTGGGYASGLRNLAAASWLTDEFAYLKSDGSLCDGVEIVTHPATLDAWRSLFGEFAAIGQDLAAHGWEATESCGIHVHACRAAFTSGAHLARHGVLWHAWRDDLVPVCGRESSTYAQWSAEGRARVVAHATGLAHCPRYSPINYQPSATVEVRCFASTLDADVLAGLVELVAASVEFSRGVTSADILAGRAGWEWFVSYVNNAGYRSAGALMAAREGN